MSRLTFVLCINISFDRFDGKIVSKTDYRMRVRGWKGWKKEEEIATVDDGKSERNERNVCENSSTSSPP